MPGRQLARFALLTVAVLGILFSMLLATVGAHHHEGGSFDQHCLSCQVAAAYAGGAPSGGVTAPVDNSAFAGSVTPQLRIPVLAAPPRSLRPRAPPVA